MLTTLYKTFNFSTPCSTLTVFCFWIIVTPVGVSWCLITAMICISLMSSVVELVLKHLLLHTHELYILWFSQAKVKNILPESHLWMPKDNCACWPCACLLSGRQHFDHVVEQQVTSLSSVPRLPGRAGSLWMQLLPRFSASPWSPRPSCNWIHLHCCWDSLEAVLKCGGQRPQAWEGLGLTPVAHLLKFTSEWSQAFVLWEIFVY